MSRNTYALSLPANAQLTLAPYSEFNRARTERLSRTRRCQVMLENGSGEGLLVRAEPLGWAEELIGRMVGVVRLGDGALLLDADPAWAGAINTVLVKKGVRVSELLARSSR